VTQKIGYTDLEEGPDIWKEIKRLMTKQHSSMIEELRAGRHVECFGLEVTGSRHINAWKE
jgi:hypothetical protein